MNLLNQLHAAPYVLIQKRQDEITADLNLLDVVELERYHRYIDVKKREEFLIGRSLIKTEIAEVFNIAPTAIILSLSDNGKPLFEQEGGEQVHFNLSHSSRYFVLALSLKPIGVDLEKKREVSVESMLPILSDSEARKLTEIPDKDRSAQVLNLFTAKEAFIKATDKKYGLDEINFDYSGGFWKLASPQCNCLIQHIKHQQFVIAISIVLG